MCRHLDSNAREALQCTPLATNLPQHAVGLAHPARCMGRASRGRFATVGVLGLCGHFVVLGLGRLPELNKPR